MLVHVAGALVLVSDCSSAVLPETCFAAETIFHGRGQIWYDQIWYDQYPASQFHNNSAIGGAGGAIFLATKHFTVYCTDGSFIKLDGENANPAQVLLQ